MPEKMRITRLSLDPWTGVATEMADWQFLAARMVAATHRRLAPPALARIPDTRSHGRRPRLGRSHPRIDGHYQSAI
jgi:hypothetical protein